MATLALMPMRHRQQRADEESRLLREAAPGVNEVAKRSAHGRGYIKPDATNRVDSGLISEALRRRRSRADRVSDPVS